MADTVIEVDCSTGQQTERELTPEEQAQREQDAAAAAALAEQHAWDAFYETRNLKLTASDWLQEPWPADLPDSVQNQIRQYEAEWKSYRQTLRDLPATVDPFNPLWPQPPPLPLLPSSAPGEPPYRH